MNKRFFLTCPKGLELLLAEELEALGIGKTKQTVAGVYVEGSLEDAYRACLWSRLANRVLLPLSVFPAETAEQLYDGVKAIEWLDHLRPSGTFIVDFTGRTDGITHTRFGAMKTKDAVVDQIRESTGQRPSIERQQPDIRINVHLYSGQATLSLDLSGDSLHRRGYRTEQGEAPLKENLAAALLTRMRWPQVKDDNQMVLDPMCGSGTLLIEAAMMAADIAPGLTRRQYGFSRWLKHEKAMWTALVDEAKARREAGLNALSCQFVGRDENSGVVRIARQNAQRAGVADYVEVSSGRLENLRADQLPPAKQGIVITNPPYGERLGETKQLMFLYRHLGETLKNEFGGWKAGVFTGDPDLAKAIAMRSDKQYKFMNGPIEGRFTTYSMKARTAEEKAEVVERAAERMSADAPVLSEGAQMFANRVQKNAKNMAKWVKRESIEAYRLYDADIPEYSVAVDIYGDKVHLQEYAPPKSVDAAKAFERLNEVMAALPVALNCSPDKIVLKQRKRQEGTDQYEKQAESNRFFEVAEHGCRLLVNIEDYLDTGLFLDHRPVRKRIQALAEGKDFLNLFSYTGTATVHAAKGGARSTTSVDMSATYLSWAERNLSINGFVGPEYRFERADCIRWLHSQRTPAYDLIFMDPPTFSNSKRMSDVLDVQRDHVELIEAAMSLLKPEGMLIFSNNNRRFRLSYEALEAFDVQDVTVKTLDPDFKRNAKIHSCFEITHKK